MRVDGNIGGAVDGTSGGDLSGILEQVAIAEELGLDAVWSAETNRDPFLPLLLAAEHSGRLTVGTAVAVAFARTPMTVAVLANDLQTLSSGRFILGLGSQIKAHVERRFAMPWSQPAARMREFVCALQAIWSSWQDGSRLDFRGDFYQHTLMTPVFSPGPGEWGPPPVFIAAVGPLMTRVAAQVADGVIVHGFTTERYLREVTMPTIEAALEQSGRGRDRFTVCYPGLLATGSTQEQLDRAMAAVRAQIAFYGATPAYRVVLELHGWGELHDELHRLSVARDWGAMTELVDDEVLHTFAVVGEPELAADQIQARFGDLVDRYTLSTPHAPDLEALRTIVAGLRTTDDGAEQRLP